MCKSLKYLTAVANLSYYHFCQNRKYWITLLSTCNNQQFPLAFSLEFSYLFIFFMPNINSLLICGFFSYFFTDWVSYPSGEHWPVAMLPCVHPVGPGHHNACLFTVPHMVSGYYYIILFLLHYFKEICGAMKCGGFWVRNWNFVCIWA